MTRAHRLWLMLPLACALVALGFQLRWLLATVYSSEVEEAREHRVPAVGLVAPGQIAVELAPWQPALHQRLARALRAVNAAPAEVDEEYRQAIAAAPSDAYIWINWAQTLAERPRYGGELEAALARVQTLAPSAPTIQRASAQMGLKHWFRASSGTQQLWLAAMGYELRHEPRRFLRAAVKSNSRYWLCASAALDLPPLQPWCSGVWENADDPASPARGREPTP